MLFACVSFLAFRGTFWFLRCGLIFLRAFAGNSHFLCCNTFHAQVFIMLEGIIFFDCVYPIYLQCIEPFWYVVFLWCFSFHWILSVFLFLFYCCWEWWAKEYKSIFSLPWQQLTYTAIGGVRQWARWQMEKHFIKIYKWLLWMCYADCLDMIQQ